MMPCGDFNRPGFAWKDKTVGCNRPRRSLEGVEGNVFNTNSVWTRGVGWGVEVHSTFYSQAKENWTGVR